MIDEKDRAGLALLFEQASRLTEANPQPPMEEVIGILRKWLPYAPEHCSGSHQVPIFKVLRKLLSGRVVEVLRALDSSTDADDHQIAAALRRYGRRECLSGPAMAKVWARGMYGWIGIEMGNPTWDPGPSVCYIELPTTRMLETLAKMSGGEQGVNEFFPNGYFKLQWLPTEVDEALWALHFAHRLGSWHMHGCNLISSITRQVDRRGKVIDPLPIPDLAPGVKSTSREFVPTVLAAMRRELDKRPTA